LLAATMADYLSGVRHNLKLAFVDVTFFGHLLVQQTKQGLVIMERGEAVPTKSMREKLPFTTDMIVVAKTEVFNSNSVLDKLIIIAMEMQIVTLFRISEMVVTADDHYLQASDVVFTVRGTLK